MYKSRKFLAFTLSEVLVTLSILGVVAALTIPILNHGTSDKELNVKLKKVYDTLNQGTGMIANDTEGKLYAASATDFMSKLGSKVKTIRKCSSATKQGCWHKGNHGLDYRFDDYMNPSSGDFLGVMSTTPGLVLLDGTFVTLMDDLGTGTCYFPDSYPVGQDFRNYSLPDKNFVVGDLLVDINGERKPNIPGKDIFVFGILESGGIMTNYASANGIINWGSSNADCVDGKGLACAAEALSRSN